jgi:gliding motility-associated-like protein
MRFFYLTLLFFSFLTSNCQIVGGELFIKKINEAGFNYELGITNYFNGKIIARGWNYSNYYLRIYKKSDKTLVSRLEVVKGPDTELKNINKECSDSLGIDYYGIPYRKKYYLNPDDYDDPGGYFIKYDECCRQHDVKNIDESDSTSIVYYGEFPSLKQYPEFSSPNFPIADFQVYCVNTSFSSGFGAIPSAGLTHRYYLDEPLTGYTTFYSPTNPRSSSLNYNPIQWVAGYSMAKPFNGSPTLSIDENTGIISGHSVETGHFVFSLRCEVYKGAQKLGFFKRDFVLTFVNCDNDNPLKPSILSDNKIVLGDLALCNNSSLTLSTESLPEYNYFWKNDGLIVSSGSSLTVTKSGLYELLKTPKNSCSQTVSSDSVRIRPDTLNTFLKISNSSSSFCIGDVSSLSTNMGNLPITWFKDGSPLNNGSSVVVSGDGVYKAQLAGYRNCPNPRSVDSLSVLFSPKPNLPVINSSYTYCAGDRLTLNANSSPNQTFAWLRDSSLLTNEKNSNLNVSQLGNYQVIVKNGSCSDTSDVYTVLAGPLCGGVSLGNALYLPTAFSPNGDGINNIFEIFNLDKELVFEFSIFDRWGNTIFRTDQESNLPWDGTYLGKSLTAGTYIYSLKLPQSTKKGTIELLK